MKIKNVLEIEYMPIFDDKFIVRIKSQNCDVLKRGEFKDEEIGVKSINLPQFTQIETGTNILYIRGRYEIDDKEQEIVPREVLNEIIRRVELINKKYGIKIRERVNLDDKYYYIDSCGEISVDNENRVSTDRKRFETGNYFNSEDEAINSDIYKIFQKQKEALKK